MKKVLSIVLTVMMAVPYSLIPAGVSAAAPVYSVHITTPVVAANPLSISGTTSGTHYVGQQSAQHVVINWGDGSVNTDLQVPVSAFSGDNFNWNWGPIVHLYNSTTTKSYKIIVNVCHQSCSGSEGSGDSTDTTIVVIPPSNTAPVAQNLSITTSEDTATSSAVKATDSDVPAQTLTYGIASNPTHGTVTSFNVSTGAFTYTPAANYHGSDSFTFTAYDGSASSTAKTVSITVNPVNDAPVANAQSVTTNEDVAYTGTLTGSDIDGDSLTFATTSNPANGTLTLNSATGAFTYTPNANFHGSDSFQFTTNDGSLTSAATTTSITVNSVNDNPVLSLSTTTSISMDELTNLSFTASATDADSDVPTFSLSGEPTGASINSSTGAFSWTPSEAQGPGTYTFNVVASDGNGGTDSKAVTVNVAEVNVAPITVGATVATHQGVTKLITLSGSDTDLPAQTLTYSAVTGPSHGTVNITGNVATYVPDTNYSGPDSFTFKANDGVVDSNVSTITISVDDGAPIITPFADMTIPELVPFTFTVSATDPDSDPIVYSVTSTNASGFSIDSNTGVFSWTPAEIDGPGVYNFTAVATAGANTDSQAFTITVTEVNLTPVPAPLAITTAEDTAVSGTVTATDADLPANTIAFATTSDPAHGTVTSFDSATGAFTYVPALNYNGPDSFTFVAGDGLATSSNETVSITVTPVNDAPVITLAGNNPMNLIVGDIFVDPGASSTDVEDGDISNGIVVTGAVDTSAVGTYVLTYTSTDTGNLSTSTTRSVIVTAKPVENTAPLCSDGIDNDGDQLTDLSDPDCAAFVPAPTPTPTPGGGGNGPIMGSLGGGGQVLGATITPQGEVLGESCGVYMDKYLRLGSKKNNVDQVKKLQQFLNKELSLNLPLTGYFGTMTEAAVKNFQSKYSDQILKPWNLLAPTGLVYLSTLRQVNMVECPALTLELPELVPWSQNPNVQ